ncbi:hypothetical protein DEIPH_ctg056orf0006 [Deinococcus phoenicis]|uniref:Uncharacterized protein n=1 Tax=Deinococcus phoenicis TaxID=1476583 RepID=A0A016QLV0_9DEIO|nr:hypothetical protein [Deinococcus phoenicis]EYB66966.1 hypothetical protein DEIPH_ctg056orf0006 [Deinococcus phoenicis]
MTRARVLGALLALILLVCGVVIYLDQRGAFGETSASGPGPATAPLTPNPPASGDPGYGELK